jgi:hypothetical protein
MRLWGSYQAYYTCIATARQPYGVSTTDYKNGQIFGNLILKKDETKETSYPTLKIEPPA